MAENETSLSDLFKQAKTSQEHLDSLDPRSDDFKAILDDVQTLLEKCSTLVSRLSLFSHNEDLDDLSTTNIQYLSIPYLQAELTMRSYDAPTRLKQLNTAQTYLESFLSILQDYSLLTSSDTSLFSSYKESRATFRITPDHAPLDSKRATKIARFQSEKALKSRLADLRSKSSALLTVDDEILRNLYLAELSLSTHNAFQTLDTITLERQILAQVPPAPDRSSTQPNDHRSRPTQNGTYSDRLDTLPTNPSRSPLLDSSGRPLQPFTITSKRSDVRRGVFQPGHSLPTMSIDEYLAEEHKRGGIIEGGGPASEVVHEPDEDDVAAQDAATMKAREWDEFVEANPKGAGNTVNRG